MEEEAILKVVTRLARPHSSGGEVIERAAILAEGAQSADILAWITAHDGRPEAVSAPTVGRGLHSTRQAPSGGAGSSAPRRYVLPPGAIN